MVNYSLWIKKETDERRNESLPTFKDEHSITSIFDQLTFDGQGLLDEANDT